MSRRGGSWRNRRHLRDIPAVTTGERARRRAQQIFNLGVSLGPQLQLQDEEPFVATVQQLMDEYLHYLKNPPRRGDASAALPSSSRIAPVFGMVADTAQSKVQIVGGVAQYKHFRAREPVRRAAACCARAESCMLTPFGAVACRT